jgi:hypothetical protein
MLLRIVGVVVFGIAVSCGGDASNAPAKCDNFVNRLCQRAIACANDGTTQAECVAAAKTTLPCAQADAVSDGYNACMSELQSSPCSVLITNNTVKLPATCNGTILFEQ